MLNNQVFAVDFHLVELLSCLARSFRRFETNKCIRSICIRLFKLHALNLTNIGEQVSEVVFIPVLRKVGDIQVLSFQGLLHAQLTHHVGSFSLVFAQVLFDLHFCVIVILKDVTIHLFNTGVCSLDTVILVLILWIWVFVIYIAVLTFGSLLQNESFDVPERFKQGFELIFCDFKRDIIEVHLIRVDFRVENVIRFLEYTYTALCTEVLKTLLGSFCINELHISKPFV